MEKHLTKSELADMTERDFLMKECEAPFHWCSTGIPIPEGSRMRMPGCDRELRRRQPCAWYDKLRGCTHPKHPHR